MRVKTENALYPQSEITVPNTERNSRVGKKKNKTKHEMYQQSID